MTGRSNLFSRYRRDFRGGLIFFIFFSLALLLPSPVLADPDKNPPNLSEDRDIYFYENVYPYRRHWHSEGTPKPDPLPKSQTLKGIEEQSRAKFLEHSRVLKEFQEQNRAKAKERSLALKEIQKRSKAKFQERSRALKKLQEQNKAKFQERSRTLKEILEQNKAKALENRRRRKN